MANNTKHRLMAADLSAAFSVIGDEVGIFPFPGTIYEEIGARKAVELKKLFDLMASYSNAAEGISGSVCICRLYDVEGSVKKIGVLHLKPNRAFSGNIGVYHEDQDIQLFPDSGFNVDVYTSGREDRLFPDTDIIVIEGNEDGVDVATFPINLEVFDKNNRPTDDENLIAWAQNLIMQKLPKDRGTLFQNMRKAVLDRRAAPQ